jgi:negative regulator of flagellin synthesis FlgM
MNSSPNNHPAGKNETDPTKETLVKIDNSLKSIPATRGKDAKSGLGKLLQSATQPAVSDDVQLTDTSEKLRQLESDLGSVDITDSAKIEAIRQAIADGNFKVDEEAVAEGLVQESIATISHRSRQ